MSNLLRNTIVNYVTASGRTVAIPSNPPMDRQPHPHDRPQYCVVCSGTGFVNDLNGDSDKCWHCDGTG